MPEATGVVTATNVSPVVTQTGTVIFGVPTMELATVALAFFSLLAVAAATWYAIEASRSRKTMQGQLEELRSQHLTLQSQLGTMRDQARSMEDQLKELQKQHLDQYNAYVVADAWQDAHKIRLVNLGPAPAYKIIAKATYKGDRQRQYLQTGTTGLPVGQSNVLFLKDIAPFADIPENQMNDQDISIIIYAHTVLGEPMDPRVCLLPRSF